MKNKKRRNIIIAFIVIIILILGFFGTLYYVTNTVNNYSFTEKRWINDNLDKTFDIYVEPSLPVFSLDGNGVFYDFINALKENTGLNLNIITTEDEKIKLHNKNSIDDTDIVIYKDHYIVSGTSSTIIKLSDLENKKIGVIKTDTNTVKYYLTEYSSITISEYNDFAALETAYINKQIDYMIIPMYKYLNEIVSNDYEILYHLDGLYSYYCLDLDKDSDENLNNIMTKFYYRYQEKANSKINEYFLNLYYDTKNYTELQKDSITNEDILVGYIDNIPYEGMIGNDFTGLTNTYLSKFSSMTGVTYKYIEYKDTKELGEALKDKKIDIALNYYSLSNENYDNSKTLGSTEYVVLAHEDNNLVVNSLYSLVNTHVDMLNNMNLK